MLESLCVCSGTIPCHMTLFTHSLNMDNCTENLVTYHEALLEKAKKSTFFVSFYQDDHQSYDPKNTEQTKHRRGYFGCQIWS